jgi:DNA-binding transcriptional regulator YhcF (GntR family)
MDGAMDGGSHAVGAPVVLDPASGTPPYAQVRDQLAGRIRDGTLPLGTRLPTVRGLAADLDLAPNTVARAYRELEAGGLVATQGRRGTVVAAATSELLREAQAAASTYAETARRLGLPAGDALALVRAALDLPVTPADRDV